MTNERTMVVFSMMTKTIKITMFDVNDDDYSEVLSVMIIIIMDDDVKKL